LKIATPFAGSLRLRNSVEAQPGRAAGRYATVLRRKSDDGVILVFWLLILTALFGFMALAINLGNLLQSTDNVQNAADSAATSGASSLAAGLNSGSPFYTTVSPFGFDCRVNGSHITVCNGGLDPYRWLIPQGAGSAYIYENIGLPNAGWWQIVPESQAGELKPGQTTDSEAFSYGTGTSGSWSCSLETASKRRPKRCLEVTTGVTGTQDGALSNGVPVAATNTAMALVQQSYGINPNWSGCSGNLPAGFAIIAEGWAGVTCMAYCISLSNPTCGGEAGTSFWVMALVQAPPSFISGDGVTCTGKAAWANAAGLLAAAPAPSGNCG
jgi:hypothetical protein